MRSVGNSKTLRETALIEAFNLKAAIEFFMGNEEACREALLDMPPRTEQELDPVTLHNQALMIDMQDDPTIGRHYVSVFSSDRVAGLKIEYRSNRLNEQLFLSSMPFVFFFRLSET